MARNWERSVNRVWMEHYHGNYLEAVNPCVIRGQKTFFGGDSNNRRVGDFYELVTAGIFGGHTKNYVYVEADSNGKLEGEGVVDWNVFGNGSGRVNGVMPDVVDNRRRRMFESKAVFIGSDCILRDTQIESYKYLQLKNPEHTISIALYKHDVPGIKGIKGGDDALTYELGMKTKFSVVFPISIGNSLHQYRGRGVYRYEQEKRKAKTRVESPNATYVFSGTTDRILVDPLGFIADVGLDPKDYVVERRMSPLEYSVLGKQVIPFPILWIKDKSHDKWMERFAQLPIQVELFEGDVPFDVSPQDGQGIVVGSGGCSDADDFGREEF